MKPGLDKYLVNKYPKIFVNRHGDKRTTAMCWGFDINDGWFSILDNLCHTIQTYIDNNSKRTIIKNKFIYKTVKMLRRLNNRRYSKYSIIRKYLYYRADLFKKVIDFIDSKCKKVVIETIPQVVATQVKEKYGLLNFYYNGGDECISGMVYLAETLSENVCEFCGTMENVGQTTGWIYTICDKCHKSHKSASNLVWNANMTKDKLRMFKLNIVED